MLSLPSEPPSTGLASRRTDSAQRAATCAQLSCGQARRSSVVLSTPATPKADDYCGLAMTLLPR